MSGSSEMDYLFILFNLLIQKGSMIKYTLPTYSVVIYSKNNITNNNV